MGKGKEAWGSEAYSHLEVGAGDWDGMAACGSGDLTSVLTYIGVHRQGQEFLGIVFPTCEMGVEP